jgi:hypothetical protein
MPTATHAPRGAGVTSHAAHATTGPRVNHDMPAARPRRPAAAIASPLRALSQEWARISHDADRRNEALALASIPIVIRPVRRRRVLLRTVAVRAVVRAIG